MSMTGLASAWAMARRRDGTPSERPKEYRRKVDAFLDVEAASAYASIPDLDLLSRGVI